MLPLGFLIGVLVLVFVWSPNEIVPWFIAALIPGAVAFYTARVPEDYEPPPITGIAAGLWAAFFWIPLVIFALTALGIVACVPEPGGVCS